MWTAEKVLRVFVIAGFGLSSIFLLGVLCGFAVPAAAASADARRVRTGRFTYRDRLDGKDVGAADIVIRRLADSNYSFSAEITGAFRQCWESVATLTMLPISAKLSMGEDSCRAPRFELEYHSGRVTGFALSRKGDSAPLRRSIDDAVPAGTIDQRIDWANVLATDFQAGQTFEFAVYDPGTGVSRVVARSGRLERVEVPAGVFDSYRVTYEVAKSGGLETYVLFVSAENPRMMIREDFPGRVVGELTGMKADD